ncbi:MAG TPA: hypothetical protein VML75_13580 [Kofleriaceae bacterium]|nr:hypothetical protein [Kofleriaceae bacterium]
MRGRIAMALGVLAIGACGTGAGGGDAGRADAVDLPIPPGCNGAAALCDRRFDEVAYPTTHNAMSNEAEGWVNPNQYHGLSRQLEDGVRGLMLDVHPYEGDVYLCHGVCQLGSQLLVDGLSEIRAFLDLHRGEVVTIIFESYVGAAEMAAAFEASGAIGYVHAQAAGETWPALGALIAANRRLVVVTDAAEGGAHPWYMDVWAHAWETHYAAREIGDFSCDRNRGSAGNPLFIFNHFLTRTRPVPEEADVVNANPLLIDRARECMTLSGSLPNFVTVDFYSVGDLFAAVDALNGI